MTDNETLIEKLNLRKQVGRLTAAEEAFNGGLAEAVGIVRQHHATTQTPNACCLHLQVHYCSMTDSNGTKGWWACGDCHREFIPVIDAGRSPATSSIAMGDESRDIAMHALSEYWKKEHMSGDWSGASFWFLKGWELCLANGLREPALHSVTRHLPINSVADSLMEFIPSRMGIPHDPTDPSSYKWARRLAEEMAKAAITAYKEPGHE